MDATPQEVEADIRDTWGVAVQLAGVHTWAHQETADTAGFGAQGGSSADRGASVAPGSPVLRVASGVAPGLAPGSAAVVGGAPAGVRAVRRDRDPAFLLVLLSTPTHGFRVFRPQLAGAGMLGRRSYTLAPVVTTGGPVAGTLVERAGDVVSTAAGEDVVEQATASVPPSTDVRAEDRVVVSSLDGSAHTTRWRVMAALERGSSWDTELHLERTEEEFGG